MRPACTKLCVLLLGCLLPLSSWGEQDILMARSQQAFPEAMLTLQESIRAHGYTVSRVQRIDIGLTGMGYKTDRYRIVFFGKIAEIRQLSEHHPTLIPYLPLKFSIFAEGKQTLVLTIHPVALKDFAELGELGILLDRWTSDIQSILNDIAAAD